MFEVPVILFIFSDCVYTIVVDIHDSWTGMRSQYSQCEKSTSGNPVSLQTSIRDSMLGDLGVLTPKNIGVLSPTTFSIQCIGNSALSETVSSLGQGCFAHAVTLTPMPIIRAAMTMKSMKWMKRMKYTTDVEHVHPPRRPCPWSGRRGLWNKRNGWNDWMMLSTCTHLEAHAHHQCGEGQSPRERKRHHSLHSGFCGEG